MSSSGKFFIPGKAGSLWEVLKFKAERFLAALNAITDMNQIAIQNNEWFYGDQDRIQYMIHNINILVENLEILDLRLSYKKAKSIKTILTMNHDADEYHSLAHTISNGIKELGERIQGELEDRALYYVEARKADYLHCGLIPFGNNVSDKFPEAATDLVEASVCLGLSRNAACVFHLMRAMEIAVKSAGAYLGVTIIGKDNTSLEWGKIIANMKIPIENMEKSEKRDGWSEILSLLYHVKQAWRNSTMHPKQTYTDEEAQDVYDAVKSFIRHLAVSLQV